MKSVLGPDRACPLPALAGCLVGAYFIMKLRVGGREPWRLCARINFFIFFPECTLVGLVGITAHGFGEEVKEREDRIWNYSVNHLAWSSGAWYPHPRAEKKVFSLNVLCSWAWEHTFRFRLTLVSRKAKKTWWMLRTGWADKA